MSVGLQDQNCYTHAVLGDKNSEPFITTENTFGKDLFDTVSSFSFNLNFYLYKTSFKKAIRCQLKKL